MTKESIFLLLAAVGLVPIALSYGVYPAASTGSSSFNVANPAVYC